MNQIQLDQWGATRLQIWLRFSNCFHLATELTSVASFNIEKKLSELIGHPLTLEVRVISISITELVLLCEVYIVKQNDWGKWLFTWEETVNTSNTAKFSFHSIEGFNVFLTLNWMRFYLFINRFNKKNYWKAYIGYTTWKWFNLTILGKMWLTGH